MEALGWGPRESQGPARPERRPSPDPPPHPYLTWTQLWAMATVCGSSSLLLCPVEQSQSLRYKQLICETDVPFPPGTPRKAEGERPVGHWKAFCQQGSSPTLPNAGNCLPPRRLRRGSAGVVVGMAKPEML